MNTEQEIQQAIKWFANSCEPPCSEECEQCKMENIALAALRKEQEREKGCHKCNDPNMEYGAVSSPRTETGKVNIKDMQAEEAYYCPNCGRKLKSKEV